MKAGAFFVGLLQPIIVLIGGLFIKYVFPFRKQRINSAAVMKVKEHYTFINMKKRKRISLIVFSVILVGFILQQLYYRVKYDGDLVFYISNESLVDSARLEIYIDGTKVLDGKVTNTITHLSKPYPVKTTLGNHTVIIKMNGEATEGIKLNTVLITFINVDYYGDRLNVAGCEDRKHFNISIRKLPIYFIA